MGCHVVDGEEVDDGERVDESVGRAAIEIDGAPVVMDDEGELALVNGSERALLSCGGCCCE